jgi:hypothetical protein
MISYRDLIEVGVNLNVTVSRKKKNLKLKATSESVCAVGWFGPEALTMCTNSSYVTALFRLRPPT